MSTQVTIEPAQAKAYFLEMEQKIADAIKDYPHVIALDALLQTFIVVAELSPCCTGNAARAAIKAGYRLVTAAEDHALNTH